MRVHILGICGTFMGGIAAIAKEAGHDVSGADQNVYPPMSTQLQSLGIRLQEGYDAAVAPDVQSVVVGNALSRGRPVVEALLNSGQLIGSVPFAIELRRYIVLRKLGVFLRRIKGAR